MIVCGDFIDAQFGVMFGLTTMASAGSKKISSWANPKKGTMCGYILCTYIYIHIYTYFVLQISYEVIKVIIYTTMLNNDFHNLSWEYRNTY